MLVKAPLSESGHTLTQVCTQAVFKSSLERRFQQVCFQQLSALPTMLLCALLLVYWWYQNKSEVWQIKQKQKNQESIVKRLYYTLQKDTLRLILEKPLYKQTDNSLVHTAIRAFGKEE